MKYCEKCGVQLYNQVDGYKMDIYHSIEEIKLCKECGGKDKPRGHSFKHFDNLHKKVCKHEGIRPVSLKRK